MPLRATFAGRLARDEHGAGHRILADPRSNAMPSRRGAKGTLYAADPRACRGDRPCSGGISIFQPDGKLALCIDHEQPLGQLSRSARPREAPPREIEHAGCKRLVGRRSHARTLPKDVWTSTFLKCVANAHSIWRSQNSKLIPTYVAELLEASKVARTQGL